jgi:hypothetical protein
MENTKMTFEEFRKYQYDLLQKVIEMGETKGKEYANGKERFGNFNRLSEQLVIERESIGWIYLVKHLDAIESFLRSGRTYSTESIESRFIDAITYLTLIAGMIHEQTLPSEKEPILD